MDKEKEIEEMTVEELAQYGIKYLKEKEAIRGNVEQAVKEFAENLIKNLKEREESIDNQLGFSEEYKEEVKRMKPSKIYIFIEKTLKECGYA